MHFDNRNYLYMQFQIPEGEEIFYVNLSNPTGDSTLGEFLVASIHILQNDDPIYFQGTLITSCCLFRF